MGQRGSHLHAAPVISSVMGMLASKHFDSDTVTLVRPAGGAVVCVNAPVAQAQPGVGGLGVRALEQHDFQGAFLQVSREALAPPSRLCHLPTMEAARSIFQFAARQTGEEDAFPTRPGVREDSCRALSSGFQSSSCNRLRRAGRASRVMTDSPKHQDVVGGLSALGCHQSPRLL